jgi:anti-anti-sigma factor
MLNIATDNDRITVIPKRDFDSRLAHNYNRAMIEYLMQLPQQIVVDMKYVRRIDSIGIGMLIGTFNTLKEYGGKLHVINLNANLYNFMCTMRLNHHFECLRSF